MPRNNRRRVKQKIVENIERSHGPNITALNDDCLREIFSNLSAKDLAAVKMSCDRFVFLADESFEKNCLSSHETYEIQNEDGYDGNAAIMSQFGHLMPSVDIDLRLANTNSNFQHKYLSWLKHCPALQRLSICGMNFAKVPVKSLEIETFEKLEQLSLIAFSGPDSKFKWMLKLCDPMKMKKIILCSDETYVPDSLLGFLADRFVNLEFVWIFLNSTSTDAVANVLKMKKLKKLKTFDIKMPSKFPIASLISAFAETESLEELTLRANTVMDEEIAKAINSLPENVLHCKLWLDAVVPESLLLQITNFKNTDCTHFCYSSGRDFFEYEFIRCTSNCRQ